MSERIPRRGPADRLHWIPHGSGWRALGKAGLYRVTPGEDHDYLLWWAYCDGEMLPGGNPEHDMHPNVEAAKSACEAHERSR